MANFTKTLFCAGFGGQGVMVLGQLIAYGGIKEGRYVTWLPSYGPEMRGGTANCGVTVSDREIGSPFVANADVVVTLNQPSLDKYEGAARKGGILIYNSDISSYTPKRSDIRVIPVPASALAKSVGNEKALNVIFLGVVLSLENFISYDTARETIKDKLGARKPEFLKSNLEAFELGRNFLK